MPRPKGSKDINHREKERIIDLIVNQGRKVKDVSQMFNMNEKTVYVIMDRFRIGTIVSEDDTKKPSQRGGNRKRILQEEHLDFIDRCLSVNCQLTQKF